MSFRRFISRLQKKTLFESLDQQIDIAKKIERRMEERQQQLSMDGENDWFERTCNERFKERWEIGKKRNQHGSCSNTASCDVPT